jgi:predicted TIM-barrel fold metal-dependent hydrolase
MVISTDWLISVDDHVFEPPELWSSRLPGRYREVGPRVVRIDGLDTWVYEDTAVPMTGISAVADKPKDEWSMLATNYEDLHPSVYELGPRLEAMNTAGVLAAVQFPTYPRFCGQVFAEAKDKDLALLGVQAWNDFMIDEWGQGAPGRIIPLAMVPLWDAQLAAAEATRAIEKGARGIIFCENAAALGLPSIHDHDNYWDPLFHVANDTGLPICMHVGSSSKIPLTAPDAPLMIGMAIGIMNAVATMVDWMLSGQFFRFPNLKIALSEGEIGWMPFALTWLERMTERQRWAQRTDFHFDMAHGEYAEKDLVRKIIDPDYSTHQMFRDHIYGCFIEDPIGISHLDELGIDNIMIETDFPHSDGSFPDSIAVARKQLEHLGEDTMAKILTGNACRAFQFEAAQPPS